MSAYDDARQAPPADVPCWYQPEKWHAHPRSVTGLSASWLEDAHYWTQLEPNGPVLKAPDLATLQQKCEDALGRFVDLDLEEG